MAVGNVQEQTAKPGLDSAEIESSKSSKSSDGPLDLGLLPDTVTRRCTDVPTLAVFLVALLGLLMCMVYGLMHSQPIHDGDMCGNGEHAEQRFLFFCVGNATAGSAFSVETRKVYQTNSSHEAALDSKVALDLMHPLCVESCPNDPSSSHQCNPIGSPVPDYPSTPFIGMLCKPAEPLLAEQLSDWVFRHPAVHTIATASSFLRAWQVPLACVAVAVVASYSYIFLLRNCAAFLVWAGFFLLTVVPMVLGGYFLFCWHKGGCTVRFSQGAHHDLVMGGLLLLVGVCFLLVVTLRGDKVDLAVDCLEASCECVMETMCMRLVPLISFGTRTVLLALEIAQVWLLFSCAESTDIVGNWKRPDPAGYLWAMIVYTVIVYTWLLLAVGAVQDFVVVYATEVWYFSKGQEKMPSAYVVWHAYWAALRYHLGTLALGGVVLGFTSPLRMILSPIESHARTAHTPVGIVLGLVCCCCVNCYDHCLAFLNKSAYMDVAMNAKGFCHAARDTFRVTRNEEEAVQILNGVTSVFQIFGIVGIAFLGEAMAFGLVQEYFTSDSSSVSYVHNPEVMVGAGAAIAVVVALPFLIIFDTVSDTIIYCYSVKKSRALLAAALSDPQGCLMGAIHGVFEWTNCLGPFGAPTAETALLPPDAGPPPKTTGPAQGPSAGRALAGRGLPSL